MNILWKRLHFILLMGLLTLALFHCGKTVSRDLVDVVKELGLFPEGTTDDEIDEVLTEEITLEEGLTLPAPVEDPVCGEMEIEFNNTNQLSVIMPNRTESSATLKEVSEAGWYQLFFINPNDSGSKQTNESFYVQVRNTTNPNGFPGLQEIPSTPNCLNTVFVVKDLNSDDEASKTLPIFVGTFYLDEGDNEIVLKHYCPLFLSKECREFHNGEASDFDACSYTNNRAHSVHLKSKDALCFYKVPQ